jgi:hypothetical protein
MFKRRRNGHATQVSLPNERKALVERYMIDAEEAEARARRDAEARAAAQLAAERQAELAASTAPLQAEAEAAAEPEEDALVASAHLQQATQPEPPVAEEHAQEPRPEPEPTSSEVHAEDLPLYGWLRRVEPATPDASDRLRELVRAKEDRSAEPRSA